MASSSKGMYRETLVDCEVPVVAVVFEVLAVPGRAVPGRLWEA